ALDRIGVGTAQVEIEIKGEREGQELLRKNMYYSSDDIAIQAITEIPEIIDLIVNNYFEMVNLTEINIDIRIDNKKKIGKIEEIVLKDSSIKPGDYLEAKIKIRPFRGDLIEKTMTIQIPSDTPPGEALLMVNGGGELDNQQEEFVNSDKKDYKSLRGLCSPDLLSIKSSIYKKIISTLFHSILNRNSGDRCSVFLCIFN
ncbi:unnamed protein product, partial [marine sediment metagenome]